MVPIHPFPVVRQTLAQGDCLDLSDSASKFEPRFSAKEWMKNRMSSLQTNPNCKKRIKLRHSCNARQSSNKKASNDSLNPKNPKSILKRVMMARYFSKSSSERSPCKASNCCCQLLWTAPHPACCCCKAASVLAVRSIAKRKCPMPCANCSKEKMCLKLMAHAMLNTC